MSDSLVPSSFTGVSLVLRRGRKCFFSRNGHENLEELPREILRDEPYIFDVATPLEHLFLDLLDYYSNITGAFQESREKKRWKDDFS